MDLIVHDMQDDFLFTTEYVKIRLPPNFMLMLFVNDIHSRRPCLNFNLEETLHVLQVLCNYCLHMQLYAIMLPYYLGALMQFTLCNV